MTSSRWPQLHASLRQESESVQPWLDLEDEVRQIVLQRLPDLDLGATNDAVEQICIQVAADLGKADRPEAFHGFVCGQFLTVRRRMLARAKTGSPGIPTDALGLSSPVEDDPGELALALLAQCLSALPQMDRRAVELRYFRRASLAEIASGLGVPEKVARRHVFNGLSLLRRCMEARRQ